MLLYPIYKAIKQHLGTEVPVFFYLGQYTRGKDNTSYRVPAIYIEMPKDADLKFYGKKLLAAKNVPIKIHYISYAPFKSVDNTVQDTAIATHENKLKEIDKLMDGWNATNLEGKLLTQQLLPTNSNTLNFDGTNVYSIITYTTEIYSRHLQES